MVVVKPAGVATELTTDPAGASMIGRVRAELACPGAKLPHRLDRVTRGLVVVALTDEAIAFHGLQIAGGLWEKRYIARIPMPREIPRVLGEQRMHLRQVQERGRPVAKVVRSGGQAAVQDVELVVPAKGRVGQAHALIRLITGRFHQIRAMMAGAGSPLIGDRLYGGAASEMYLEHAWLRFTPFGADAPITVFDPDDPDREPIDPKVMDRLLKLTAG